MMFKLRPTINRRALHKPPNFDREYFAKRILIRGVVKRCCLRILIKSLPLAVIHCVAYIVYIVDTCNIWERAHDPRMHRLDCACTEAHFDMLVIAIMFSVTLKLVHHKINFY